MTGSISMEPGIGPHYDALHSGWGLILGQVARGEISPREGAIRIIEHSQTILTDN